MENKKLFSHPLNLSRSVPSFFKYIGDHTSQPPKKSFPMEDQKKGENSVDFLNGFDS